MKPKFFFILVSLAFFLAACNFSLAADITPPPGYQPPVEEAQAEVTSGPLYPIVPPDIAKGESIFAENCAPCHGATGLGDGPSTAQLPNQVPALGTTIAVRRAIPAVWFHIVTQGNVQRFMPPFSSLTDRQRWDVVAYALSLGTTRQNLAQGAELFAENCTSCHGKGGKGDGPQGKEFPVIPDFTNQEYMAGKTGMDFFQAITEGVLPGMPAYGEQLAEADRWALSEYLRSLTSSLTLTPTVVATSAVVFTPTTEISSSLGTVSGVVNNLTTLEPLVAQKVILHGIDQMAQLALTQTVTTDDQGAFLFENVEFPEGRVYLATVEYQDVTYGSTIGTVEPGLTTLNLPIDVYEITQDPSILNVDRLHYFFEFLDEQTLRVVELYVISNPGKKTLAAASPDQPVLTFTLPQLATNLNFEEGVLGERFIETDDGFGDTLPVRPGTGDYQILFSYEMPYDNKLDLSWSIKLATSAVVILVPEDGIKVRGEGIQDAGTRDMQGVQYHLYNGNSLAPGGEFSLTITGNPSAKSPTLAGGSRNNIFIGLGALGITLILAGVWLYLRNKSALQEEEPVSNLAETSGEENPETVMDAILALDDLYQAGQLPEEAYRQRRAELKQRLAKLRQD